MRIGGGKAAILRETGAQTWNKPRVPRRVADKGFPRAKRLTKGNSFNHKSAETLSVLVPNVVTKLGGQTGPYGATAAQIAALTTSGNGLSSSIGAQVTAINASVSSLPSPATAIYGPQPPAVAHLRVA